MRCWLCDAVPAAVYDVESTESAAPIARIVQWPPPTDHEHAEQPPTPAELEESGHEAMMRMVQP